MKIESIIKRAGGTVVDMDAPKRQYHFKPEEGQSHESPHVAIVGEKTHAMALLRIREGFRLVDGEQPIDPEGKADGFLGADQTLTGSNVHNSSYPIAGGETILLGDLVVMAFQDSGVTYEEWEELADQERYEYIDATLKELQAGEGEIDAEELNNQQQAPAPVVQQPAPAAPAAPVVPVDQKPEENLQNPPADGPAQENNPPAPPAAPQAEQDNNPPAAPLGEVPLVERPRKELVDLYKTRFGRVPSTKMSITDIATALSEED